MMRRLTLLVAAVALVAAAPPPAKLAPSDDPVALVGAAARAKHGIEPLAKPTDDLGMAEDPASPGAAPVQPPIEPPVPAPTTPTPSKHDR